MQLFLVRILTRRVSVTSLTLIRRGVWAHCLDPVLQASAKL